MMIRRPGVNAASVLVTRIVWVDSERNPVWLAVSCSSYWFMTLIGIFNLLSSCQCIFTMHICDLKHQGNKKKEPVMLKESVLRFNYKFFFPLDHRVHVPVDHWTSSTSLESVASHNNHIFYTFELQAVCQVWVIWVQMPSGKLTLNVSRYQVSSSSWHRLCCSSSWHDRKVTEIQPVHLCKKLRDAPCLCTFSCSGLVFEKNVHCAERDSYTLRPRNTSACSVAAWPRDHSFKKRRPLP